MDNLKSIGEKLRFTVTLTILIALVVKNFFNTYAPTESLIPNKIYGLIAFWLIVYFVYELLKKCLKDNKWIIKITNLILIFNFLLIAFIIFYLTNIDTKLVLVVFLLSPKILDISMWISFFVLPFVVLLLFIIAEFSYFKIFRK